LHNRYTNSTEIKKHGTELSKQESLMLKCNTGPTLIHTDITADTEFQQQFEPYKNCVIIESNAIKEY